ncbi:hypothetical protein [Pseudorhodoferax sp. Leaf274]|uniref:hypothetical protein n=1 Tax=Pseudorhodoferax sp. Leaf274 TaxID=1736318 RepID=UPI0007034BC4|nr:hypothetical protein [Pseudorhodoferax sp. Leaf274]KQP35858.1 hypothetical protein ASF44_21415 [Pseudorhodoferax sp. Leaf274]
MAALLRAVLDAKRLATLQARAALRGYEVHAITGDRGEPMLVATRAAATHHLDSLDALERWLANLASEEDSNV